MLFWVVVCSVVMVAVDSLETGGPSKPQTVLQPVAAIQAVTLFGRKPEVVLETKKSLLPPSISVLASKAASFVKAEIPHTRIATEQTWYSRSQLNWACGLELCSNVTAHCWGNPSSFLLDSNTVKPDGSHHQHCCRFSQPPIDPEGDPSKLVPTIAQCRNGLNGTVRTWCVSPDDE
jgi:hypothetical protein